MDKTSKLIFSVIAVALTIIALKGSIVTEVDAQSPTTCRMDGTVRVEITRMPKVELSSGNYSGNPIYIQQTR